VELLFRLSAESENVTEPFSDAFNQIFSQRIAEANAFYDTVLPDYMSDQHKAVSRQAYAGLLWSRQFYHYAVLQWLAGDPSQPAPPPGRKNGRNAQWRQLFNRDVLSIPDKWEYPWYAAWDLSFHMLPFARIDPAFAKEQLVLLLREWYMHPNGQLPAYEFAFGDANPPVHPWACWRVYKISAPQGQRDRAFLERNCWSILPGGSTARISRAGRFSAAASSALTTWASSIGPNRCPPVRLWNKPTAPRGWPSIALPCSPWHWNSPKTIRSTKISPPSFSSISSRSPTP
jgi:hypothetical protein